MNLLLWFSITLSALGLFLSSWIVIPAPIFALLPLGVGAPEISPLLLLGNAIALTVALLQFLLYPVGGWRYLAIALSTCALILSSLPLLQLAPTVQQAERQMQAALGKDYLTQIPAEHQQQMRSRPVVWMDLVRGIATPDVRRDRQSFTAVDGTPLELLIYQPETAQLHPAIIAIYGGAWQRGDPGQNAAYNAYLAAQGYTVVAIDYRHAPEHRFPAQLQDVETALEWIVQNAANYQIDTSRIALIGWSSGAHLALLAAYQPRSLAIRAVVNYYGPTNLTEGYRDPPRPDPINTRAVLEALLGGSPDTLPQEYKVASPVHAVRPGSPPTLLIYGDRDHLVKPVFGRELYDRLQATQNRAILIALPWSEHAFDAVFQGLGNQIALYYTERFLAWTLKP
jgi:acetyl esterase/lipase